MSTSKPKIIKSGLVHLFDEDGTLVTLGPGDAVPEWATVTNPALFEGEEPDEAHQSGDQTPPAVKQGDTPPASGDQTPPAKEPSQAELKDQAKALGLPTGGSKKALAERIAAKLAEAAPAPAGASGDDEDSDRAALEARAKEAGIEFDENTTEDELAALLDD